MKTDPTLGISGAAGMPLSHEAIQSGKKSAARAHLNPGNQQAISDTLETSDREGDGRQQWELTQTSPPETHQSEKTQPSDGDRLDLTG
jgi:hypothetical protein